MSVLYFKRWAFYGDFRETEPKWHVTTQEIARPYSRFSGKMQALCGYSYPNTLGDLDTRKTRPAKPRKTVCLRCETARKEVSE